MLLIICLFKLSILRSEWFFKFILLLNFKVKNGIWFIIENIVLWKEVVIMKVVFLNKVKKFCGFVFVIIFFLIL